MCAKRQEPCSSTGISSCFQWINSEFKTSNPSFPIVTIEFIKKKRKDPYVGDGVIGVII